MSQATSRMNYVGAPQLFDLSQACRMIVDAFDSGVYLVGSSIVKRDFRDVDVRCIMSDDAFLKWFGSTRSPLYNPRLSLLNSAISAWLSKQSGLPVDFQIQQQTDANAEYSRRDGHQRQALGIYINREALPEAPSPPASDEVVR